MQILVEIPQNHYAFFKALIRKLSFPKIIEINGVEQEATLVSKAEFFAGLRESFEQMRLIEAGKLPKVTVQEMIKEVERELANE